MFKPAFRTSAVAIGAMLLSAPALAIEFTHNNWKMDISGSVNGFYTSQNCKPTAGYTVTAGLGALCANDNVAVQNGLLPGYVNFTASTQQRGWDVKGQIGFWPGTSANQAANSGGGDTRTVWLSFGKKEVGSFKIGRDIGLFQQQAILNDMTLIGVGTGANFQGAINTTLGMIGAGYIYTEFQPQITYTAPKMGGASISLGVFQPRNVLGVGGATVTKRPGYQGLFSYDFTGGKVWASFATQQAEDATGLKFKGNGYELGGKASAGGFEAMLVGFTGKGLGDSLQFVNSHDAAGNKRKSNGYLAQVTYKAGDLKFGLNHGENRLEKANNADTANLLKKNAATTLGLYYSLTENVTLVGEFIDQKQNNHLGQSMKANTVAAGAILFF